MGFISSGSIFTSRSDAIANLGTWTPYTPTLTAATGSFTTASATSAYMQIGKLILWRFTVSITTVGTAAGAIRITAPVTASSSWASHAGAARENATTGAMGQVNLVNSGLLQIIKYDNTTLIGAGNSIIGEFFYEAA